MPIYEYECSQCGHTMEALQKLSDPALTECPACHTANLHKKVSAAAFHLKGSGWYATDFKDKPKNDTKKDSETTKASDKPETKTNSSDNKTETKKSESTTTD